MRLKSLYNICRVIEIVAMLFTAYFLIEIFWIKHGVDDVIVKNHSNYLNISLITMIFARLLIIGHKRRTLKKKENQ